MEGAPILKDFKDLPAVLAISKKDGVNKVDEDPKNLNLSKDTHKLNIPSKVEYDKKV